MKIFKIILNCAIGCALGSGFGLALIAAGHREQGVGVAIIGGALGVILAVSSVLYKTSSAETFSRGLLLFLKMTAEKNIPGGDRLVPLQEKDMESRHGQSADPVLLDDRMYMGIKVGAVLSVAPAILIATHIQVGKGEPDPIIDVMERILIGFVVIAVVGVGSGAALGSLTVSGVHRRNIALGTIIGMVIGAGLATAIAPGARVPVWHLYAMFCGAFGWLGMAGGLFSSDNFRPNDHDVPDEGDDITDA